MSAPLPATPPTSDPGAAVGVGDIERAFSALWKAQQDASADQSAPGKAGSTVTRACMSNLIVVCHCADEVGKVAEDLGVIVARHPARAVVVNSGARPAGAGLAAHVSAICHRVGHGEQVCSEHAEIEAPLDAVDDVASVVRSLLLGDLPSALWWAEHPPRADDRLLAALAPMAGQLIFDSGLAPENPTAAAAELTAVPADGLLVDLAWSRLQPWRRLLAQALDPAVVPAAISAIDRVEIDVGSAGRSQGWWLAAWLASRLNWQVKSGESRGDAVSWKVTSEAGPVAIELKTDASGDGIKHIRVHWKADGQAGDACLRALDARRVEVAVGDGCRLPIIVSFPAEARGQLVARRLSNLSSDQVFQGAIASADALRRALRK